MYCKKGVLMRIKSFFIDVIERFLAGQLSREDVATKLALELPLDNSIGDETSALITNCEWSLRHINEPEYWTTKEELAYYLRCLKGEREFSTTERDNALKTLVSRQELNGPNREVQSNNGLKE